MRLLLPRGSLLGAAAGGARVPLPPAAAHKLKHVLRAREGARVLAFDGENGEWACAVGPGHASLAPLALARPQGGEGGPLLAFAPLRPERTRFLVEKATELGAGALLPVATVLGQRVEAAPPGAGGDAWSAARGGAALRTPTWPAKAAEWAAGAAEQCGRLAPPRAPAPAPVALRELLWAWSGGGGGAAAALAGLPIHGSSGGGGGCSGAGQLLADALRAPAGALLLVADAGAAANGGSPTALPSVAAALREWRGGGGGGSGGLLGVLVGPEGGWAASERAAFAAMEAAAGGPGSLRRVNLAPLTLRADTAALAALAQIAAARLTYDC
jgi:16S rRNA U1498 N3-methylase RsmE